MYYFFLYPIKCTSYKGLLLYDSYKVEMVNSRFFISRSRKVKYEFIKVGMYVCDNLKLFILSKIPVFVNIRSP